MLDLRERRWLFEHTHMKMNSIQHQLDNTPPPPLPSSSNKISPALLFVIIIVAVLFFISGILHLLVRFLSKHQNPSPSSAQSHIDRYPESNTLQRQLQQLFHLHDSGLDQTFIDSLPVFMYKELVGAKEPFDCPVCLCEFSDKDKLRMLPICNHAFHINCIDTWLLSNSTCPLCRGTLFSPGRPIQNPIQNPVFELDDMREDEGFPSNGENGCSRYTHRKSVEMEQIGGNDILQIRLGKFRKLDDDGDDRSAVGETSSSSLDDRRCFSMGSYEYVVRDANLMVSALRNDSSDGSDGGGGEGKKISFGGKTDSYSESKIWMWSSSNKHKLTTSLEDQERRSYLS